MRRRCADLSNMTSDMTGTDVIGTDAARVSQAGRTRRRTRDQRRGARACGPFGAAGSQTPETVKVISEALTVFRTAAKLL